MKNKGKKIRYLLILINKMPIQGSVWLKNIVLDRLYPKGKLEAPYRNYINPETKIEAIEVGEQNFNDWTYITMAGSINFQKLWGEIPDTKKFFDNLRWQPFGGQIGKGAILYW